MEPCFRWRGRGKIRYQLCWNACSAYLGSKCDFDSLDRVGCWFWDGNVSNDPVAHFCFDWVRARGCIRIREDESIGHVAGMRWRRDHGGRMANTMNIEHRSNRDVGGRNFVAEIHRIV